MENQKKTSETKIENLTKSIAYNLGEMFRNKYTPTEGKSNDKTFPDFIFLGEATKEYMESLEEFFNLKGYDKNDIEKSNLLEQESPLFFILQSLLLETELLPDNRFNQSRKVLRNLGTQKVPLDKLLEKLKEFMESNNFELSNPIGQLEFIWNELQTTENRAFIDFKSARDLKQMVRSFAKKYERMGVLEANIPKRMNYAKQFLNQYDQSV
jgi:hypothetical protein